MRSLSESVLHAAVAAVCKLIGREADMFVKYKTQPLSELSPILLDEGCSAAQLLSYSATQLTSCSATQLLSCSATQLPSYSDTKG